MRKNIEAVIAAFKAGKAHRERTCHTDGKRILSYEMEIALKMDSGRIIVVPEYRSPSRTTTTQIRAVRQAFGMKPDQTDVGPTPDAAKYHEGFTDGFLAGK